MSKKEQARKQGKDSVKKQSSKSLKSVQQESEQERANRQREMIDHLNRQNIHNLLSSLQVASQQRLANQCSNFTIERIQQQLNKGAFDISEKLANQPKLSDQEIRQADKRTKRESLRRKIEYLYDQIRGDGSKEGLLQVQFKEVLSKDEHQRWMQEIIQQKAERKRRYNELLQEEDRRQKDELEREQELRSLEKEKAKQSKRSKIQASIQKRKAQHKQFLATQQILQQKLSQNKSKPRLYKEMQRRFQSQVLLPELEEKKLKLKELRDFHRQFNLESIKEHQRNYLLRQQKKIQQKIPQEPRYSYQPPKHTERLSKLLQEESKQIREQLGQKRRHIQQMQKRQELYQMEIKRKHRPKIDQSKRQEIEERLIQEQRKKEKVVSLLDSRKLGEGYLEIAKSLKRFQSLSHYKKNIEQPMIVGKPEDLHQSLQIRHSSQFYEIARRHKIDSILNSEETANDKYFFLKQEADKLNQKLKQKQQLSRVSKRQSQGEGQLLLSSIKAKMGIVSLLNNQPNI